MTEKYLQLTTVREDFNEYEIENGQLLKTKNILMDLIEDEGGKLGKQGSIGFQTVSHVRTPILIDTTNLELALPEQVTDNDIVQELKFKIIKEIINIYESEKTIIFTDTQMEKIFLTKKKDKDGNPILRFRSGLNINVIPKRPEK
jgi:hypothetical protein